MVNLEQLLEKAKELEFEDAAQAKTDSNTVYQRGEMEYYESEFQKYEQLNLPDEPPVFVLPDPVPVPKQQPQKRYFIGYFSAVAFCITMGIALMLAFVTGAGIFTAMYIAPVYLIYFGLELLVYVLVMNKRLLLKPAVDLRTVGFCLLLVALTFLISSLSVITRNLDMDRERMQLRFENEISLVLEEELSVVDNISGIFPTVVLLDDNINRYQDYTSIRDTDILTLNITFSPSRLTPREFAKDCSTILRRLEEIKLRPNKVEFISDDGINFYQLKLDSRQQLSFDELTLYRMTGYYGNNISEDIEDLK
jgi:hypothetical protein